MVIIATVMVIIAVDYLLWLIGPGCKNLRMFLLLAITYEMKMVEGRTKTRGMSRPETRENEDIEHREEGVGRTEIEMRMMATRVDGWAWYGVREEDGHRASINV